MKTGYIKLKKKRNSRKIKDIFYNVHIEMKDLFNYVDKDKNNKPIYSMYNSNIKSKEKLLKKIKTDDIDYIIQDFDFEISYSKLNGRYIMRAMIPELLDICYKNINPILDEVHICTNVFNKSNIELIKNVVENVKVVNLVTENKNYYRLERNLEEKNIFITVSSNKRNCLKRAWLALNLDFEDFNEYNINRHMVIIDVNGKLKMTNGFDGIVIRNIEINTNKVLRVFSEFESFNKKDLIESEIIKLDNYQQMREYIAFNKIYINGLYNNGKIEMQEFDRIKNEINQKRNRIQNKKKPTEPTRVEKVGDD